jgi:hypothetical protein
MVSSSFGIVITHLVDTELQVLYANEFQRPDSNNMLNVVMDLVKKYEVLHFWSWQRLSRHKASIL